MGYKDDSDSEDLAKDETYINEVYDQLIKESSVIESVEEIAKRIEHGKKMIEAFKIEDQEAQDAAIKTLMMEQVKPEEDKVEAEKQIDEMLKGMRNASNSFKSMIKQMEEYKPTPEELERQEKISSMLKELFQQNVIKVDEENENDEEDVKIEPKTEASNDRLIKQAEKPKIDYDSIDEIYG